MDLSAAGMIKVGEVSAFFHFSFLAFKYLMDTFLRGVLLQGLPFTARDVSEIGCF